MLYGGQIVCRWTERRTVPNREKGVTLQVNGFGPGIAGHRGLFATLNDSKEEK
jgi:hypothetical protein